MQCTLFTSIYLIKFYIDVSENTHFGLKMGRLRPKKDHIIHSDLGITTA